MCQQTVQNTYTTTRHPDHLPKCPGLLISTGKHEYCVKSAKLLITGVDYQRNILSRLFVHRDVSSTATSEDYLHSQQQAIVTKWSSDAMLGYIARELF